MSAASTMVNPAPVFKLPPVREALVHCLSRLAGAKGLAKESTETLHRQVVTMMMMEVVDGRADLLEEMLRGQPEDVLGVGYSILNYIIDSRRLHDHAHHLDWTLFAIPVCVFSGSMPLSLAVRLSPDQVTAAQKALVRSGLAKSESSIRLHDSLVPCSALWDLRLVEQMMLIPQVHSSKVPDRLAFSPYPAQRGEFAPYMLLGVSTNARSLLSSVKNAKHYEKSVRAAITPSFERVDDRMCTVSLPRPYSFAMRGVVGDFLSQIVRSGLAMGAKSIVLKISGLEAPANAPPRPVRVTVKGHPLPMAPFVFHVPHIDRKFVLQQLRRQFDGLPVTLHLPS